MTVRKDIEATIQVDGADHAECEGLSSEAQILDYQSDYQPSRYSKYIKALTDAAFEIRAVVPKVFAMASSALSVEVQPDDTASRDWLVPSQKSRTKKKAAGRNI